MNNDMNKTGNKGPLAGMDLPVTKVLIAVNVVVFVVQLLVPGVTAAGQTSTAALARGAWWTLLTSMFMHGGIMHLACNMMSLWWLGNESERRNGSKRFLELYLLGGLAGGLAYIAVSMVMGGMSPALGASGAIFALMGDYGTTLMKVRQKVQTPAIKSITSSYLTCLAINLFIGITNPGIALEAHVGGFVAGALLGMVLPNPPKMVFPEPPAPSTETNDRNEPPMTGSIY